MKAVTAAVALLSTAALAQTTSPTPPPNAAPAPAGDMALPANTVVPLISADEISSINMKVGDTHQIRLRAMLSKAARWSFLAARPSQPW